MVFHNLGFCQKKNELIIQILSIQIELTSFCKNYYKTRRKKKEEIKPKGTKHLSRTIKTMLMLSKTGFWFIITLEIIFAKMNFLGIGWQIVVRRKFRHAILPFTMFFKCKYQFVAKKGHLFRKLIEKNVVRCTNWLRFLWLIKMIFHPCDTTLCR